MKNRYFIVSYSASLNNESSIACSCVSTKNGLYINQKSLMEQIKQELKHEEARIIILNIIEVDENDFNQFIR